VNDLQSKYYMYKLARCWASL